LIFAVKSRIQRKGAKAQGRKEDCVDRWDFRSISFSRIAATE
jgi:hypothetical protein